MEACVVLSLCDSEERLSHSLGADSSPHYSYLNKMEPLYCKHCFRHGCRGSRRRPELHHSVLVHNQQGGITSQGSGLTEFCLLVDNLYF